MNSRTRLLLALGIPLLFVIVVVGIFIAQSRQTSSAATSSNGQRKLTPMTLAMDWTPNTNHTGLYVAQQKGWFRDQGIDLKILPYSSNVSPDVLVSSGKADVGISSTESIVADEAAGQRVVSLAAIVQHNTSALVVLVDSGVKTPKDLDGKTYAGFGAAYENAVVGAIIRNGGGKGQFRNVTLNVDAMQALESHRADFAWVFEGWEVIQAQRDGHQLKVFPITDFGIADYYTPNFVSSPKEISQKPDLLRHFMAATSQGYEYARSHPDESAQMLLAANKGAFPDPGLVTASQKFLSAHYVDNGRKWGLQDATAWHGYPEFILTTGSVQDPSGKPMKSLDFDALYTNQFLP